MAVVDPFGTTTVTIKKPQSLCAPTDVDGSAPAAPAHPDHLEGYQRTSAGPFERVLGETVTDRFGSLTLDVLKPIGVTVPSAVNDTATPAAPSHPAVDGMQCYKIKVSKGTAKFVAVPAVALVDHFGAKTVTVQKPTRLCAPANLDGLEQDAETHAGHLLCYKVHLESSSAVPTNPNFVAHAFGPETLDAKKLSEICVPATRDP